MTGVAPVLPVCRSLPAVADNAAETERCGVISALVRLELNKLEHVDKKAVEALLESLVRDKRLEERIYELMRDSWREDASRALEQMDTLRILAAGTKIAFVIALFAIIGAQLFNDMKGVLEHLDKPSPDVREGDSYETG